MSDFEDKLAKANARDEGKRRQGRGSARGRRSKGMRRAEVLNAARIDLNTSIVPIVRAVVEAANAGVPDAPFRLAVGLIAHERRLLADCEDAAERVRLLATFSSTEPGAFRAYRCFSSPAPDLN
jgi:hypothetical protein